MTIYQPYTYLIGWTRHQKYYYGVRYAQGCHPDDLWRDYFTSSKLVEERRFTWGEPDIIQVRKIFSDADAALFWENKFLTRINAHIREDFLNMCSFPTRNNNNRKHSEETKRKISEALRGIKRSEETKRKVSEAKRGKNPFKGRDGPNKGKTPSLEQREKISKGLKKFYLTNDGPNKDTPRSQDTKMKIAKALVGRKHSEHTKQKMTDSQRKAWIKRKAQI